MANTGMSIEVRYLVSEIEWSKEGMEDATEDVDRLRLFCGTDHVH